jgi:glutamate-5-semialdehyde dehydrogenase
VPTQDRGAVGAMLTMPNFIDVIIPRGGKTLCERVQSESRVPTLLHLEGNCHTYIHHEADLEKAVKVVHNAKLRRTGICGATESLVIDRSIAAQFLPKIVDSLVAGQCEIRGDKTACGIDKRIIAATDEDWVTEYLSSIISVKVVDSLQEAINFINTHGSHHTDAIITENQKAADIFTRYIDSAIVMHNTSTQFADGGEFGMGAEIGISTGRLHARGPVGVEQLTIYKYIVSSDGAIRAS